MDAEDSTDPWDHLEVTERSDHTENLEIRSTPFRESRDRRVNQAVQDATEKTERPDVRESAERRETPESLDTAAERERRDSPRKILKSGDRREKRENGDQPASLARARTPASPPAPPQSCKDLRARRETAASQATQDAQETTALRDLKAPWDDQGPQELRGSVDWLGIRARLAAKENADWTARQDQRACLEIADRMELTGHRARGDPPDSTEHQEPREKPDDRSRDRKESRDPPELMAAPACQDQAVPRETRDQLAALETQDHWERREIVDPRDQLDQ